MLRNVESQCPYTYEVRCLAFVVVTHLFLGMGATLDLGTPSWRPTPTGLDPESHTEKEFT